MFFAWATLTDVPGLPGASSNVLRIAHLTAAGQAQPPHEIARGVFDRLRLIAAGRGRALLAWYSHGDGFGGATIDGDTVTPFTNLATEPDRLAPNVPPFTESVAVDRSGTGILAWARTIRQPTATDLNPERQIRYALIPRGAHAYCRSHPLALSPSSPQLGMDAKGGGYLLWINTRNAIEVAHWRRHASFTCS